MIIDSQDSVDSSVEKQTATIRVMQVGGQQLSQSIVKQLDDVDWRDITPFGRIFSSCLPFDSRGGTHIIGANRNGDLVRAIVFYDITIAIQHHEIEEFCERWDSEETKDDDNVYLDVEGSIMVNMKDDDSPFFVELDLEHPLVVKDRAGFFDYVERQVELDQEERRQKNALREMPLIVLAD